jgi:hypothetical protein
MMDWIYIGVLLVLITLMVLKWTKVIQAALLDVMIFILLAVLIGMIMIRAEVYWGLLPLGLGFLAILKYWWDTRLKNEE